MTDEEKAEIRAELDAFENNFLTGLFEKFERIASEISVSKGQLMQFNIMQDFPGMKLGKSYSVCSGDSIVRAYIINTESDYVVRGRYSETEYEFFDSFCICVFKTRKDFGRTIIRTERILDKVSEIFGQVEFDFEEFEQFSSKYYCLSNHPERLKLALDKKVTGHFENFSQDVAVEFHDNICVVKNKYSVRQYARNFRHVEFSLGLQSLIG
jgi:hypothetical protein